MNYAEKLALNYAENLSCYDEKHGKVLCLTRVIEEAMLEQRKACSSVYVKYMAARYDRLSDPSIDRLATMILNAEVQP